MGVVLVAIGCVFAILRARAKDAARANQIASARAFIRALDAGNPEARQVLQITQYHARMGHVPSLRTLQLLASVDSGNV